MHLSQDSPHHTPQWDFVKRFVTRFAVFQVQTVFIPSAQRIEIEPLLIFQVLIWQKHMSGHRDSLVAKSFFNNHALTLSFPPNIKEGTPQKYEDKKNVMENHTNTHNYIFW